MPSPCPAWADANAGQGGAAVEALGGAWGAWLGESQPQDELAELTSGAADDALPRGQGSRPGKAMVLASREKSQEAPQRVVETLRRLEI